MSCALRGCKSHHRKNKEGYSFHRIPNPRTALGERWLNFLRFCNEDNDWLPRKEHRLCSKHFTTDYFFRNHNNTRTYLKDQAIPTIIGRVTSQTISHDVTPKKMPSHSDVMVMVPSPGTAVGDPHEIRERSSSDAMVVVPSPNSVVGDPDSTLETSHIDMGDPDEIRESPPVVSSANSDIEDLLEEMNKNPSPSDTMVASPIYEMEALDELYEVPLVTQAPAVSSTNKVKSCCNINKELSKRNYLLEKSVNRVQKVADRRILTIKALRAQLRRLRKSKEREGEKLNELLQKEKDDNEYITVMKCLRNKPLLDHFISSARGKKPKSYNAGLKKYAMTLHLISPRAYNFVREEFDLVLPHPKTVAKWCRKVYNPDLIVEETKYDPGLTRDEYEAIKERVKKNNAQPIQLVLMD